MKGFCPQIQLMTKKSTKGLHRKLALSSTLLRKDASPYNFQNWYSVLGYKNKYFDSIQTVILQNLPYRCISEQTAITGDTYGKSKWHPWSKTIGLNGNSLGRLLWYVTKLHILTTDGLQQSSCTSAVFVVTSYLLKYFLFLLLLLTFMYY